MKSALKSIFQFAALGAMLGLVFGLFWWIGKASGLKPDVHFIDAPQVITIIVAPGVAMFRGTDGAWVTIGNAPGEIRWNLELLLGSIINNCILYIIFGTLAVILSRTGYAIGRFLVKDPRLSVSISG